MQQKIKRSVAVNRRNGICEPIAYVPDLTHMEWLEFRHTGFGGSDAPTIADLNPHNSRYALYLDKLGKLPPIEDNEAMRQGRDLEEYVARRWSEATGKRCRRNNYMWRSIKHPWMIADIDREVCGENAGLECKTTSAWHKTDLEAGDIPLTYYCQCQHYCSVLGFDRMYLAVLVLGGGFYHFVIERDDTEIEALAEREKELWDMIKAETPPEIDGSDATSRALAHQYPASDVVDMPAELTDRSLAMLRTIDDLDEQIKELQSARKAAQAAVEAEMGACAYGSIGEYSVSWKSQNRTSIDTKRLKSEAPEIYEKYAKTSTSRAFRIKKKEESE